MQLLLTVCEENSGEVRNVVGNAFDVAPASQVADVAMVDSISAGVSIGGLGCVYTGGRSGTTGNLGRVCTEDRSSTSDGGRGNAAAAAAGGKGGTGEIPDLHGIVHARRSESATVNVVERLQCTTGVFTTHDNMKDIGYCN